MKTQLFSSETVNDLTVTIGPDGEYPTWIRNGLLDALGAAARTVAKCTSGTYTNTCPGTTAMAYCPRKQTKFTNCEVPKYWGINYQDPKEANAAPPNLGFNIEVEEDSLSDLCTGILTGLGAVAGTFPAVLDTKPLGPIDANLLFLGAVNGVGGGIFTLLTFACTSA